VYEFLKVVYPLLEKAVFVKWKIWKKFIIIINFYFFFVENPLF
jgi:hypothetical protein